MQSCLGTFESLQSGLKDQLHSLEVSLYRCLLFHEPQSTQHTEMRLFCGVINSGQQLNSRLWKITVLYQFSLYVNFHHFYFPSTTDCKSSTSIHIEATKQHRLIYCGHRRPWSISFPQSHLLVKCQKCDTPEGYHFVMIFEAFDFQTQSVRQLHNGMSKDIHH